MRISIRFYLLFAVIITLPSIPHFLHGQTNQRSQDYLDSLRQNNVAIDILEMRLTAKGLVHEAKWDSATHYYEKALKTSRDRGMNELVALNLNALLILYTFQGDYRKAQSCNTETILMEGVTYDVLSDAYMSSAAHFAGKSMSDTAEFLAKKSIEIDRNHKDSRSLPMSLNTLGRIKSAQGSNTEALNLYLEALSYLQDDTGLKKAHALKNVAAAFYSIKNNTKAREYLQTCQELCRRNDFKNIESSIMLLSAHIYRTDGNIVMAIDEYQGAMALAKERKADYKVAECLLGLAQCNLSIKQPSEAYEFLNKIKLNTEDNEELVNNYEITLAEYYILVSSEKAVDQIQKVQDIANQNKDLYFHRRSQFLSYLFYKNSKPAKALDHYEKYTFLSDSIFQTEQSQHMNQMEAQYDLVNKEKQIAVLDAENALSELKISQQKMTVLLTSLGLGLFVVLSFFLFRLMRKVKIQNSALEVANNEKSTLLREIHHRVKNNLQVISSLLALQSSYIEDDSAVSALKQGQDRVQSMALIHQDLYQQDNLSGVNCQEYFTKLVSNLIESYSVSDKEILLDLQVDPIHLDVDTMIPLGLVLNELISNSLKHAFTNKIKGKITVKLSKQEEELVLFVKDDGVGLDSIEDLKGKSFGYELIRAFAQKLNASIENDLENGFGTKLRIRKFKLAA